MLKLQSLYFAISRSVTIKLFLFGRKMNSHFKMLILQYENFLSTTCEKRGTLKSLLEQGQRMFSKISLEEQEDKRKRKRTQKKQSKGYKR